MSRRRFSSGDVCAIAEVSIRKLDSWTRDDLVTPTIQKADGPGSERLWSEADLLWVMVIKDLRDVGIKNNVIKKLPRGRVKFHKGKVTVTIDINALRRILHTRASFISTPRRGRPKTRKS